MKLPNPLVVAAAAAVLAGGCDAAPPPVDTDAEIASLRATAEAYHRAASAKDRDNVVAMYDEDALMIPPNAELVEGLAGVREYRFGFIETEGIALDFELVRAEVGASGDIGWTLAIGDITINQPDGTQGRDVVRDFHTWKKQPDGSWKIVIDTWNSGMPAG